MLAKKVADNCTPAEKSFGLGSTAECLESLAGQLVGCRCFAINNFGAVNLEQITRWRFWSLIIASCVLHLS